uniref:Uncharacterized protein n=1 Tax=Anguilla anguilla TaxID=7936 RepID=A0A0E9TNM6_ANGAN
MDKINMVVFSCNHDQSVHQNKQAQSNLFSTP